MRLCGILIVYKLSQKEKALRSIYAVPSERKTCLSCRQPMKAHSGMIERLLGRKREEMLQPEKEFFPKLMRLSGKSMLVRLEAEKAWSPIETNLEGRVMLFKLQHPLKVASAIHVILPGMDISLKERHSSKAFRPIWSRLLGRVR